MSGGKKGLFRENNPFEPLDGFFDHWPCLTANCVVFLLQSNHCCFHSVFILFFLLSSKSSFQTIWRFLIVSRRLNPAIFFLLLKNNFPCAVCFLFSFLFASGCNRFFRLFLIIFLCSRLNRFPAYTLAAMKNWWILWFCAILYKVHQISNPFGKGSKLWTIVMKRRKKSAIISII